MKSHHVSKTAWHSDNLKKSNSLSASLTVCLPARLSVNQSLFFSVWLAVYLTVCLEYGTRTTTTTLSFSSYIPKFLSVEENSLKKSPFHSQTEIRNSQANVKTVALFTLAAHKHARRVSVSGALAPQLAR